MWSTRVAPRLARATRHSVISVERRTRIRAQSTMTESRHASTQKPLWTTGRVVLLTAFTGSLAYLVGVGDTSSFFRRSTTKPADATKNAKPVYATKRQMEEVQ